MTGTLAKCALRSLDGILDAASFEVGVGTKALVQPNAVLEQGDPHRAHGGDLRLTNNTSYN